VKNDPRTLTTRTRSRALRRDSSDAEQTLWRHLRSSQLGGAKFRRQHPIGPYFADFCCVEAGLIVEVDGGQHAQQVVRDGVRNTYLEQQGFRVLRFWNHDVLARTTAVLEVIAKELGLSFD